MRMPMSGWVECGVAVGTAPFRGPNNNPNISMQWKHMLFQIQAVLSTGIPRGWPRGGSMFDVRLGNQDVREHSFFARHGVTGWGVWSHWRQSAYARMPRVSFLPISVPQRVGFSSFTNFVLLGVGDSWCSPSRGTHFPRDQPPLAHGLCEIHWRKSYATPLWLTWKLLCIAFPVSHK